MPRPAAPSACRRVPALAFFAFALALCTPVLPSRAAEPETIAWVGGRWYDGETFVERTMWSEGNRLRAAPPAEIATKVDLEGGFVVPPFAEAHNHNLGTTYRLEDAIAAYLEAGVFYVKILSDLPRLHAEVKHRFGTPESIDVAFAHGGITASGGHPIRLREHLLEMGVYPGFTKETLADHAYFVVDSLADVGRIWPILNAHAPDFVKTFLVYSEEHGKRRDDPDYFGRKGLDPAHLPAIVEAAHAAGLRVSTHVNTATDFHHAVAAGTDEIAHLPGFLEPTAIRDQDARAAADAGVVVVTTASLARRYHDDDPEALAAVQDAQRANLRRLLDHGVTLAVGSDEVMDTSVAEIAYLRGLGVLSNRELLAMWAENAAQTTFPDRRIGRLDDGYEASFLVLAGNPLEDFDHTGRIRLRVKDGRLLDAPPASLVTSP